MATVIISEALVIKGAPAATVSDDQDAVRLRCSQHKRAEWCDHMSYLCDENNRDRKQIVAINGDPTPVTVPLMPSKGVWASVLVEGLHHGGMHSVLVCDKEGAMQHLGVIAPDEGRYAIRLMLFDWLRFKFVDAPPCGLSTHPARGHDAFRPSSPAASRPRTADPTYPDLLDTFYVLTKGACAECLPYLDGSSDVPEV